MSFQKMWNKAKNTIAVTMGSNADAEVIAHENPELNEYKKILSSQELPTTDLYQSFDALQTKMHAFCKAAALTSQSFTACFSKDAENLNSAKELMDDTERLKTYETNTHNRIENEAKSVLQAHKAKLENLKNLIRKFEKNLILKKSAENKRDELIVRGTQKDREAIIFETTKRTEKASQLKTRIASEIVDQKSWDQMVAQLQKLQKEIVNDLYEHLDKSKETPTASSSSFVFGN